MPIEIVDIPLKRRSPRVQDARATDVVHVSIARRRCLTVTRSSKSTDFRETYYPLVNVYIL